MDIVYYNSDTGLPARSECTDINVLIGEESRVYIVCLPKKVDNIVLLFDTNHFDTTDFSQELVSMFLCDIIDFTEFKYVNAYTSEEFMKICSIPKDNENAEANDTIDSINSYLNDVAKHNNIKFGKDNKLEPIDYGEPGIDKPF